MDGRADIDTASAFFKTQFHVGVSRHSGLLSECIAFSLPYATRLFLCRHPAK